jgi:N-acetylmuramoyl-L-alanine amidase
MKIGIRGGHSAQVNGAIGIVNEYQQMQKYYQAVKEVLEKYGHTVIDCNSNASTEGGELAEGANKSNSAGADLFISLHMNAFNGQAHGTEVLVSSASSTAYPYAKRLVQNFSELGFFNRGVKFGRFYEMNHVNCGNIISELCFCDSEVDMAIYNQYSWEKLAHVLCNAIDSNIPKDVTGESNTPKETINVQLLSKVSEPVVQPVQYTQDNNILAIQKILNKLHFTDKNGNSLVEDGISGANTIYAIKKLQSICRLDVDGIVGNDTQNAINYILSKPLCGLPYKTPVATRYIQYRLGIGVDGIFGNGTKKAVIAFQKNNGLDADGLVGNNTWNKLI